MKDSYIRDRAETLINNFCKNNLEGSFVLYPIVEGSSYENACRTEAVNPQVCAAALH